MKIITFLTDFGTKDGYVAQMKGVISSIADSKFVDITHDITPHDVREGALILQSSVSYFPLGTVHIAVVDPGVGTARRGIIVATRSQILIGPDNGLLMPAAHSLGDFIVYEITNKNYMLNSISNTFHGRDIFSPVAAQIINGIPFEEIGIRIYNFIDLTFGKWDISGRVASGKIIYIDRFGNIVTNIKGNALKETLDYGMKFEVFFGNKKHDITFVKSYNFVKKGHILATINSNNLVEIAVNQGNASRRLAVNLDDDIKIIFN